VLCEPVSDCADRHDLEKRVHHALYEQTGIHMTVQVLPPGSVPRSEGKAVRVIDRRPC
jgi:phenylacetate-CoA ligase